MSKQKKLRQEIRLLWQTLELLQHDVGDLFAVLPKKQRRRLERLRAIEPTAPTCTVAGVVETIEPTPAGPSPLLVITDLWGQPHTFSASLVTRVKAVDQGLGKSAVVLTLTNGKLITAAFPLDSPIWPTLLGFGDSISWEEPDPNHPLPVKPAHLWSLDKPSPHPPLPVGDLMPGAELLDAPPQPAQE